MASDVGSSQKRQPSHFLGIKDNAIDQFPGSVRGDPDQPSDFSAESGFWGHESLLRTERLGFAERSSGNCRLDCILNSVPIGSGRDSE
jgi:hypothetical protein